MPDERFFEKLKEIFVQIDNAPVGNTEFFHDESKKESYESAFTIAFRKYQGAQYHYKNVLNLYENEKRNAIQLAALSRTSPDKSFIGGLKMLQNADDYVYELSAFLASIKSCLDFLASASRRHIKGFENMDSIKTLMRQVETKGWDEYLFSVVKNHINWLIEVRDYRHKVIHRTIILTKSSVIITNIDNRSEILIHSIFVPKKPPRYMLDTRRSQQQFLEDFKDYDFEYSIDDKGKINYNLPKGISTIEDFMKNYLDLLIDFSIDLINQILSIGFRIV